MNRNPELEQFFCVYNQSNLENSVEFLSLCSKIEAHVPGILPNILALLKKIQSMGLLTPELEKTLSHRHQNRLGIFSKLVDVLFKNDDNINLNILFETLNASVEIYQITHMLLQKNIINSANLIQSLFYFLFCNPGKNIINYLAKFKDISILTSETYMEWSYESNFAKHFESYLALIALSQQNAHQCQFPFILSRAHQPFVVAELLCNPTISPFFKTPEVLNPLSLSHLPELTILLIYLEKSDKAPKSLVKQILQRLTEQEQISMDLVNLKNTLIYLFRQKKIDTFEFYQIFWVDLQNSFLFCKIYHLLTIQNQALLFDKIIEMAQFIEAEKLLLLLENMNYHKVHIDDQLYFLQQPELLQNIDEHFQHFKILYSQNVFPSDLGPENFVRFLNYNSSIINDILIFFKKQTLLNPEFCSQTLPPQIINRLIEHEILTLLFDIPIHEIYNYLLFHFAPNNLIQGFETLILMHKNFLLETENWANNLSAIRVIPEFQTHVKYLFQLADTKQLTQRTFDDFILRFTPHNRFFNPSEIQKSQMTLAQHP